MSTPAAKDSYIAKLFAYRDFDAAAPDTELGRAFVALKSEHPEAAAILNSTPGASTPSVPPELAAKARDLLLRVNRGELKLQTDRYGYPMSHLASTSVDREAINQLTRLAATAKGGAVVAGVMASLRADREIPELSLMLCAGLGLIPPVVPPLGLVGLSLSLSLGLDMALREYRAQQGDAGEAAAHQAVKR